MHHRHPPSGESAEYTLLTETLSYDREAVLGQIELTLANRQSGQIYSKGGSFG